MAKVITPRIVGARMLAAANAVVEDATCRLAAATLGARAIESALSDTASVWANVYSVDLEDARYYFVQRVVKNKPLGDVCLAQWQERGWREVIGRIISSHAQGSNLLVLVPKQRASHGKKATSQAKRKKPKRQVPNLAN